MIHIHQKIHRHPGPDVTIHCPACGESDVSASTYDETIQEELFSLVPVNRVDRHYVVCSNCRIALRCRVPVAQLERKTAGDLIDLIYAGANSVQEALAVIAFVIAILIPCLGTVLAGVAVYVNHKIIGWPKTLSFVALGISLLLPVYVIVSAILSAIGVLS